jgi:hypothetical protein
VKIEGVEILTLIFCGLRFVDSIGPIDVVAGIRREILALSVGPI